MLSNSLFELSLSLAERAIKRLSASLVVDQDQHHRFNDFTAAGLLNSREFLLACPYLTPRTRLGSFGRGIDCEAATAENSTRWIL